MSSRWRAAPGGAAAAVMLGLLATAGFFYVNIMPALVDGLMRGLGFSSATAGLVSAANVYGAAVGAFAASFAAGIETWKPLARVLLTSLIAIDLASTGITLALPLVLLRLADGLVGGFLVGIAFAVIARTPDPDRVFGTLLLVQFALGGIGLMVLPGLVASYGTAVLFLALILVSLTTLLTVGFLDDYPPPTAIAAQVHPITALPVRHVAPALVAIFLFQAANQGVSAFIIPLGEAAGLDLGTISPILGVANWIGLAGSALVIVLSRLIGRALPLAIGLVVTAAGLAAFAWSPAVAIYGLANAVTSVTWCLVIPYLFGICAALDRRGRIAVLGSFASKIGLASGPLAAGFLSANGQYAPLLAIATASVLLAALIIIPSAIALDRRAPLVSDASTGDYDHALVE